jgi:hypothetical protein
MLETAYFLLYAIPWIALGIVHRIQGRAAGGRFLLILFLGTFSAYALLPLFPIHSPRVAFAGADLPH